MNIMFKIENIDYRLEDGDVLIDNVPIFSNNRISRIKVLGIARKYDHQFKSGNDEVRWDLVENLDPEDKFWFVLEIYSYSGTPSLKLVVEYLDDYFVCEWVTENTMRKSRRLDAYKYFSKIEATKIKFAIDNFLCEDKIKIKRFQRV